MTFLTAKDIKCLTKKYPDRIFFAKVFIIKSSHSMLQSFSRDKYFNLEVLGEYYNAALLSDKELYEEINIEKERKYRDFDMRMFRLDSLVKALGQEHLLALEDLE